MPITTNHDRPTQTISGARAVFRIGDKKVAFATNVSYTINHEHAPVNVLDKLEVEEYAEIAYYVSVSASGFRMPGKSPIGEGWMPKLSDILNQGTFTITIVPKTSSGVTTEPILTVLECKCTQRSGSVGARDLATETYDFVGIRAGDEGCAEDPGTSATTE